MRGRQFNSEWKKYEYEIRRKGRGYGGAIERRASERERKGMNERVGEINIETRRDDDRESVYKYSR